MSSGHRGRRFYKMSGSGNDFVVFDARQEPAGSLESPATISDICARGTGVGADGVVFLDTSGGDGDLRMRYYNSDGSRAAMCGNAALCVTRLAANELAAAPAEGMRIVSDADVLRARYVDGLPEVELGAVQEVRTDAGIPTVPGERRIGFAKVGVPHLVVLCDDVSGVDVLGRGRALRRDRSLTAGANVNFVSRWDTGWAVRTYERGVEEETLACGTGAIATAVLLVAWNESAPPVALSTRSRKTLTVRLERRGNQWLPALRGEGRLVFIGELPTD